MKTIVECVPNFSEGRRSEVMDAILAALTSAPDVVLLDHEMDADHNRAVVTYVGTRESVGEAIVRAARVAMEHIDLNHHEGGHPRLGAVDVIPFVPIKGVTIDDCVAIANEVGERLWKELGLPVYFYEKAARTPARENLATVRKGQFEGIREELKKSADRAPDLGEGALHPSAGATVVGARKPLIAYNINLATGDVKIADKIARAVRHLSGGLRYVKAMGVMLEERGIAQVSMNLVDFEGTPIYRVFELVKIEAARYGINVVGSEIVGLIPQKALDMSADYFLRIENFSPDMILENRLASVLAQKEAGISAGAAPFLDAVATKTAVPGGGCVAAHAIAAAAALGVMVCELTLGKKKYAEHEDHVRATRDSLSAMSARAREGIDADAAAFDGVMVAFALPKETVEQTTARQAAIESATAQAARVPLDNARLGLEVLAALASLTGRTNVNAASDLKVGAYMAVAGIRGALENVRVNLDGIADAALKGGLEQAIRDVEAQLS